LAIAERHCARFSAVCPPNFLIRDSAIRFNLAYVQGRAGGLLANRQPEAFVAAELDAVLDAGSTGCSTSSIFDRTIAMNDACGIEFHNTSVLPMIMRGVAITRAKAEPRQACVPCQRRHPLGLSRAGGIGAVAVLPCALTRDRLGGAPLR
jgi:hypothetical protein